MEPAKVNRISKLNLPFIVLNYVKFLHLSNISILTNTANTPTTPTTAPTTAPTAAPTTAPTTPTDPAAPTDPWSQNSNLIYWNDD